LTEPRARHALAMTPTARRQLTEHLPEAVATAAYEFIAGPLLSLFAVLTVLCIVDRGVGVREALGRVLLVVEKNWVGLWAISLLFGFLENLGGALFGKLLLNVELSSFLHSFADNLKPWDLTIGLVKAVVFGLAISITSCHFGTSVKGGAVGVCRAVNNAVVAAAVAIMISDNLITMVLR